ncbi:hypothetical protein HOR96_gp33 [Agrobacterium phage Atu_ph02]|uniref:Uncharacterized protein n=1 Tax=Agrobacterium phage Atu_ph02 TaxID=2024261 RepID=A0A223VZW2_9CAUD|nr:hypothetical protein HOR96_gp33 [Agrobacterium phage Atu_ph02]ASV44571.1 hypothetical protein [Agrobacterium phage Atu_ph02]
MEPDNPLDGLTDDQQIALVQSQSATSRIDTVRANRRNEAENPVQGPNQPVDPGVDTNTPDIAVSGTVFNSDYYKQADEDYRRANEQLGDGIVGTILNPIANPAANVGRQFLYGGNIAVNVGRELYRKLTNGPADPSWTPEAINDWLDMNRGKIDPEQRWRYFGTINPAEAEALRADADTYAAAMRVNAMRGGFENFAAGALAGLIDIDTPLALVSGGLSAGAKLGINASRAGRLLSGTAAGAALGLSVGAVDYVVNPTSDAESIALMGVMGAGFGMLSGSLAKNVDAAAGMRVAAVDELGEQIHYGPLPERAVPDTTMRIEPEIEVPAPKTDAESAAPQKVAPSPQTFDPEQVEAAPDIYDPITHSGASSVGARQTGQRLYDGPGRAGITNKESLDVYDTAAQWKRSSQAVRDYEDPGNLGDPKADYAVNKAIRFQQGVNALGLGTDFDTFMRSGLATAQWFASNVMESASGIGRNRTNAAVIKEAYQKELVQKIRPIQQAFREWHFQEQGHKWYDWVRTPQGQGAWKSKDNFHWEVIKEQMARRHGGQGTTSPAAKKAADALEEFYKKDYEIGLGNKGQKPVSGYDTFTREPGYVSQHWSGRKMSQAIEDAARMGGSKAAKRKRKDFIDAIDEEYARLHGTIPATVRRKMATAVVDRALASRRGFQHDLIGLLRGDESEFIRAALARNGVSEKEIDKVIESIVGSRQQKTRAGHTQSRTDVDFRSVASNGVTMRDLLETDLDLMTARRANTTSGAAALARMGIPDKVSYERIKKAILDEQQARGKKIARPDRTVGDKVDDFIDREPEITEELLDAVYGYFHGSRPGAGQGIDATVQRIKKVTRLSLMNQLGLTSLAEHGAIAGTVGMRRWFEHIGQDLRQLWGKPDNPLNQELRHFAFFENEESLFNGRLLYEMDKAQSGELLSKLDSVLNKGLEVQGHLSGYHAVVSMQQRVAISSLTARIFEGFKTGKGGLSEQRTRDLGIDDAFMARVSKFAQFDGDNLVKLNMDQWDWEDVQLYQQIMARGVNQLVQKALIGESNWAFHSNGLAQLFLQFKSFPLLAVHKQFARNMRMADLESINTFFYGLITAGMAYSARQAINGNTDNLTPEKIAKGALNYSNVTGWLPMFVDPVLNAAGADFDTSGYSSYGVGSIISLPASFGTLEKLVQVPFLPAKLGLAAAGQYEVKNSDIRILQSLPILGNAYGVNALLNLAKDTPTRGTKPKNVPDPKPEPQAEEQEFDPVAAALAVIQPPQ